MTLIEDAYEEMISEYGRTFEHYSHQGTEDDFWNDDQGFPDEPTDEFKGQMVIEPESDEMTGAGFLQHGEFTIRTLYDKVEVGDMIAVDGEEFKVSWAGRREIQGRTLGWQLEVTSANV